MARVVFVGDHPNDAEALQPFPDDFSGVSGGSATAPTPSPRGGDTYLGPAGTAANQAINGAAPTFAAAQEEMTKLDLSAVRDRRPYLI